MDKSTLYRVRSELQTVGAGTMGLNIPEAKTLAGLIMEDEHIGGVIYGSYSGGAGMLVATNKRLIFIDRKPGLKSIDEFSYVVVSGIKQTKAGFFNTVTVHSRAGDYKISYVKPKCADIFVKYIENKITANGYRD